MVNTRFEAYKIKRELKRSGTEYEFKRYSENDFKETSDKPILIGKIVGLYHEQSSGVSLTSNEATQVRTKKIPMILCLYEDVILLDLKVGDFVELNTRIFKVVGIINIQEWNIVSDISLEVVDSGIRA